MPDGRTGAHSIGAVPRAYEALIFLRPDSSAAAARESADARAAVRAGTSP
jgi:hypothetical protein